MAGSLPDASDQLSQAILRQELLQLEAALDGVLDLSVLTRLGHILMRERSEPRGLSGIRIPRHDDAHRGGPTRFDEREQLTAVHARHAHVGDNEVDGFPIENGKRLIAADDKLHTPVVPVLIEPGPQPLQQFALIVDEKDASHGEASSRGR